MTERPWELLSDAGAPRPLRPEARDRLEALLLTPTAWYDEETALGPAAAALPRVGEPRSLPVDVRSRLAGALPSPAAALPSPAAGRRRRALPAAWLAAAAAVVVALGASGAWLQRDGGDAHSQLATGRVTPTPSSGTAEPGVGTGAIGSVTSGSISPGPASASPQQTTDRPPPAFGAAPAAASPATATAATPTPSARPATPQVTGLSPAGGPSSGGTWVTVSGVALRGATAVAFGDGTATRVVLVSDTQLRALSPSHLPGPVSVQVTTPGGTSIASTASQYLYAV